MNPQSDTIKNLLQEAWDHRVRSQYTQANGCLEKARELCQIEDYLFLGRIAHIDRQIAADQRNWELAAEYGWKAIEYYKCAENTNKVAHALRHQADIMCRMDCEIEAHTLYQKALDIYKQDTNTSTLDLANALRGYALNLNNMGRKKKAREIWEETKGLYAKIGLVDGVEEAQSWLNQLK